MSVNIRPVIANMQPISNLIDQWILTKIRQYRTDQLKMTLEEALSSNLYETRDKTIAFLTQQFINRQAALPLV